MLELTVAVPPDLAEEFEKKLAYVAEDLTRASYDWRGGRVRLEFTDASGISPEIVEPRVREIASKLTALFQPGFRRSLVRHERRPHGFRSDPHPILLREGELKEFGPGRLGLGPRLVALLQALDSLVLERFGRFEASAHQFPSLISGEVLDRCRYLRNFPASLTLVTHLREDLAILQRFASQVRWVEGRLDVLPEAPSPFSVLLAPSVCFHWYAWLGGETLTRARTITALGKCFRYESTTLSGLERLWDFSMRELVFAGDAEQVLNWRTAILETARLLLEELDLDFEIATATDPFFVDSFAGQAAFQRGFELKYELLCTLPYRGNQLAVGSINYHQDFFGRSFAIDVDGSPSHTACIGFGLERLALAVLAQHGTDSGSWPHTLRSRSASS